MENRRRSFLKALSWRGLASIATFSIVFAFTRELVLSFGIGLIEVVSKLILYYFHERMWQKVSWGKSKAVVCEDIE